MCCPSPPGLSADVGAAYDPTYASAYEANNSCYLNKGVSLIKYTGSRGKGGTSDASAEFMGQIRDLLEDANVVWQTGELGRVDLGGGGTVAQYIANLNVDVVDLGVPVLSMHAPLKWWQSWMSTWHTEPSRHSLTRRSKENLLT